MARGSAKTQNRSARTSPEGFAANAAAIRDWLKQGGSVAHGAGVQQFFQDAVRSHGWRTADLRRAMRGWRRQILRRQDLEFLVKVADALFAGSVLEEKIGAVLLLENLDSRFGAAEFRRFESWLDRISSWADHDALVHSLIAPMIVTDPKRVRVVFGWARSAKRWRRRAACVALIRGARRKMFFSEIVQLSDVLTSDCDDMVQKGLGWLLRETAKSDAGRTVPYLMKIRASAPRRVLRTACETLAASARSKILST